MNERIEYSINFEVKTVKDLKELRRLLEVNGMNKPNFSQLARELNKSRNTVKRHYYLGDEPVVRKQRVSKIDEYESEIRRLLEDPVKKFKYIQHLYDYMVREHNIEISYHAFRHYIQKHFSDMYNQNKAHTTGPRFETGPGKQVQFDMKEKLTLVMSDGEEITLDVAVFTYGYSRMKYREVLPDKSTLSILAAFENVFTFAGGVPHEIVIDNPKSLVITPKTKEKPAGLNSQFEAFASDYGFEVSPCYPRRPETKGKVESHMKEVEALYGYNGEFRDINHINEILQQITHDNNRKIQQATQFPASLLFDKEKEHFHPLPKRDVRAQFQRKFTTVTVSSESLIHYKNKKYAVSTQYKHCALQVVEYNGLLQIYYNTRIIETYLITSNFLNYKPRLYIEHTQQNTRSGKLTPELEQQALNNFNMLEEVQRERNQ